MPTCESRRVGVHPCFDAGVAASHTRLHLPVAAACNIQCNYCHRDHACVAEHRPGVAVAVLEPWQAERYAREMAALDPALAVIGIAGPGDALADPEPTLETLRLVRASLPQMALCVATNGLALPEHADALADAGVSHVTVTVNAVDPEIGRWIYAWVRHERRVYRGREGAALLWERQRAGIAQLAARGIAVKVNTIIVPGINEDHAAEIAAACAAVGATLHNCVGMIPVAGSEFADHPAPSAECVARARRAASAHLPQMAHCARCRADAAGPLHAPIDASEILQRHARAADTRRRLLAVATHEGCFVNRHLGEAEELYIYEPSDDGFRLRETRPTPPPGGGAERWLALARLLADCRALLVAGIGPNPERILAASGLRIYECEGLIADLLPSASSGGEIRRLQRVHRCGSGCGGNALGCA